MTEYSTNNTDFPSGILVLYKPKGESSRATLNRLQRAVRWHHVRHACQCTKPPRVGHAGTLDPLAEGVLVACVGEATKLIEVIQMLPKCYTGTFQLGVTSDTEDADGTIVSLTNPPQPTRAALQEAVSRFAGRIRQRPPVYSALKIAGKRAYQLARQGDHVELATREIEVYQINLVAYSYPIFRFKIECGSGTYVRSIGRDIGEVVGSGAIMTALTRENIGPFTLADALPPEVFDDTESEVWLEHLLPLECGVSNLPRLVLDAKTIVRLLNGQAVRRDEIIAQQRTLDSFLLNGTHLFAAFSPQNQLVSLLELIDDKYVKIKKNFAVSPTRLADNPRDTENVSFNFKKNE